jgi:putative copper export protein
MMDPAPFLALSRGLHMAAILSFLGVGGFIAGILPAAGEDGKVMLPRLIRLWRANGLIALLSLMAWFVLQSAVIAGAADFAGVAAAVPVVAAHTRYGNVVVCRLVLLLLATLLAGGSGVRLYSALALIAVALGMQGLVGHAGALGGQIGALVVASEALHLLAAGLWLGALMPLWLGLDSLPASSAAAVCVRFSPIGVGCVLLLASTGLAQGMELIGSFGGLFGTSYGRFAMLKIALFLVALGLAALNRLWLTDRLAAQGLADRLAAQGLTDRLAAQGLTDRLAAQGLTDRLAAQGLTDRLAAQGLADRLAAQGLADRLAAQGLTRCLTARVAYARRHLMVSVCFETLLGLAIVTAAAFLASSPPATHQMSTRPPETGQFAAVGCAAFGAEPPFLSRNDGVFPCAQSHD